MGQTNFLEWVGITRVDPTHRRGLTITLQDEQRNPVLKWKLINARPMKWTGPTLAAKGGSDVAMEELVIASEGFEFEEV
jgi:phage tail-like protein